MTLPMVLAHSDGAPQSSCDNMEVHHNDDVPQTSPPPYSISISEDIVKTGHVLTVNLSADPNYLFKGVLLKAIPAESQSISGAVGSFTFEDEDLYHSLGCSDDSQSGVTHSSSVNKTQLTAYWKAPSYTGEFKFIASVVLDKPTFWTAFTSKDVAVTGQLNYDYDQCGNTRSCMGDTNDCIANRNCSILITFRPGDDGNTVAFELVAITDGYVAVGFSNDDSMGDDSVLECLVKPDGSNVMYASTNVGTSNDKAEDSNDDYFDLLNADYTDGVLYCNFTRPMETTVNSITTDLEKYNYYILLAIGRVNSDGTDITQHTNTVHSSKAIDIDSNKFIIIISEPPSIAAEVMAHGILMIIAWIGTTSVAVFLARYYKDMWPLKTHCKVKIWFAWHRALNTATVVITIASFILIMVYTKGHDLKRTHAIMGIITVIFSILQPIGALFRPNPGTNNRPIFNFFHLLGGVVTFICAMSTIFLSVALKEAYLPKYFYWILCGFVGFFLLCYCIMEYLVTVHWQRQKSDDNDQEVKKPTKAKGATVKHILLVLFCCGIIGFCAALIAVIAIGK